MARINATERGMEVVDLPALIGSDREIGWAKQIRGRLAYESMGFFVGMLARLHAERPELASWPEVRAKLDVVVARAFGRTDARWWINHRHDSIHWLMGWRDDAEAVERCIGVALRGGD